MMTLRDPSACSCRRARSHPPVSAWRLISWAAAAREVPAGMRSGAYSYSPAADTRTIVHGNGPLVMYSFAGDHRDGCRGADIRAGGDSEHRRRGTGLRTGKETAVTEPNATEADRQEQEEDMTPSAPELADEATPPGDEVPEADAIEQQLSAVPGGSTPYRTTTAEADEYDVLEQQSAVPVDDEDLRE